MSGYLTLVGNPAIIRSLSCAQGQSEYTETDIAYISDYRPLPLALFCFISLPPVPLFAGIDDIARLIHADIDIESDLFVAHYARYNYTRVNLISVGGARDGRLRLTAICSMYVCLPMSKTEAWVHRSKLNGHVIKGAVSGQRASAKWSIVPHVQWRMISYRHTGTLWRNVRDKCGIDCIVYYEGGVCGRPHCTSLTWSVLCTTYSLIVCCVQPVV